MYCVNDCSLLMDNVCNRGLVEEIQKSEHALVREELSIENCPHDLEHVPIMIYYAPDLVRMSLAADMQDESGSGMQTILRCIGRVFRMTRCVVLVYMSFTARSRP